MPGIRITKFAGLATELDARALNRINAQVAHNCLLWDGSLRPMPMWKLFNVLGNSSEAGADAAGYFAFENTRNSQVNYVTNFYDGVYLTGQPFANDMFVGINNDDNVADGYTSNLRMTEAIAAPAIAKPLGLPNPASTAPLFITGSSISYISMNESVKPVNRVMGVTFCRRTNSGLEESTIAVLPNQAPFGIMFEGDILQISLTLDTAALEEWGVTHLRLYRTIAGLDSGEQIGNELDANWHLVSTIAVAPNIMYNDGGAATTDPLDLYLADHFYAPRWIAAHFGLTESGWFYCATADGKIGISERYLHHAWPTENELAIPETITDVAHNYDNIYIGTNTKPYHIALSPGEGEQGLQAAATPFAERLPCIGRSMAAAPGGALYASRTGLVALSQSGQKVLTAGITKAGDVLYKNVIPATETQTGVTDEIKIERTTYGAYHKGSYYGFQAGKETTEIVNYLCYTRPDRYYGYVQVAENDLTLYKFAIGAVNETLGTAGDIAVSNVAEVNDYYGDIVTDGTYVYSFATRNYAASSLGEYAGLFAMRVNLNSQELEKIARYVPPSNATGGDVLNYYSIQDIICHDGKIFLSLYENYTFSSKVFRQVLTFDGVEFNLEYSEQDTTKADFYEICNGKLITYGYFGTNGYGIKAFDYTAGVFTELDSYELVNDAADNGNWYYGRPMFVDGTHIYVNAQTGDAGPQILNFDGAAFTVLMPDTTWSADYIQVTGGDGMLMAVREDVGDLGFVDIFKWDGATPSVAIQSIPCFRQAHTTYDTQTGILYVPGMRLDAGEEGNSGVYKWNPDTLQFDMIVDHFMLAMMRGSGDGFTHVFRMLDINVNAEVCEAETDTYFAYILSNNGFEEYTKETKVAYGKFNTVAQDSFDMCTHYFKGTKVFTTGGIATHSDYIYACTGSVFGYAVPDELLDKPALVVMTPNAETGGMNIIDRYEAPYANRAAGSWSISGPAINEAGTIFVTVNDDQGTFTDVSTLKAFSFNGTNLIEVGSLALPDGNWEGTPVFMHGEYIMVVNNLTLRAYTFDGSTFTAVGTAAIAPIESNTGHKNVKSSGSYIYVLEAAALKIYSHNISGFTLLHTEPMANRAWLTVTSDNDIFLGDTSTDITGGSGLWPIRQGEMYSWDGANFMAQVADFGITEFANIFYDNAQDILLAPIASGFRDSGLYQVGEPEPIADEGSGIYRLTAGSLVKTIPYFALGHRRNSTLDNGNNCIAGIITTPRLHRPE